MGKMTEKSRILTVNQDGRRRIVAELELEAGFEPISGADKPVDGRTELFTDDGFDVIQNEDGTYRVVQTEEILTQVGDDD